MSTPPTDVDLDAYFTRIGYSGPREPSLATLNGVLGAHTATIPFENLDVLLGQPIDLDPAAIERKLVQQGRGGYCFEQNTLLLHVLTALGFRVTPLSGRVRVQLPRNFTPPRTHLFLRVDLGGEPWLADAGIGALSLTSSIRLERDGEQSTAHEPRRILRENGRLFHQARLGNEWTDVYEFTGEEMPAIDRELANWWTSTSPKSKFRQMISVGRAGPAGTRFVIRNNEFIHRQGAEALQRCEITTPEQLLALLGQHFGLHFPAGTRFGGPGSPWPA
jgi:N-hydroxyarylamine O-acetyltransferase